MLVCTPSFGWQVTVRPVRVVLGSGKLPGSRPELYQPFMAGAHLERMLMRDFPYLRRLKTSRGAAQVNPIHNPFEQRLNKKKS